MTHDTASVFLEDIVQATFRLDYLSIYTFCLNKQYNFEEFGVTNTDVSFLRLIQLVNLTDCEPFNQM